MLVQRLGGSPHRGEQETAKQLENWVGEYHLPGIALWLPPMPKSRKCDMVVIVPGGVVIVEIKGLTKSASGRSPSGFIDTPRANKWTCDGEDLRLRLKPIGRGADRRTPVNPLPQVEGYATEIGHWLRRELPDKQLYPKALVLLVKASSSPGTPPRLRDPDGVHYFDEGPGSLSAVTTLTYGKHIKPLRRYFHALNDHPRIDRSTVRRILALLEAEVPSDEELEREGFPVTVAPANADLPRRQKASKAVVRQQTSPVSPVVPTQIVARVDTDTVSAETQKRYEIEILKLSRLRLEQQMERDRAAQKPAASHHSPHVQPVAAPVRRRQYVQPAPPATYPTWSPPAHKKSRWPTVLLVVALLLGSLYAGVAAFGTGDGASASNTGHGKAAGVVAHRSTPARVFVTPSHNIVCTANGSALRCDINIVYYGTPPVPAVCRKTPNWGHVVTLDHRGARLECPKTRITFSSHQSAKTVAYGHRVTVGGAICTSSSAHLRCQRGAHGFQLSKASYRVW